MKISDVNWELLVGVVATGAAVYAILQSERHKHKELRPWFEIDNIEWFAAGDGKQRLRASVRHVSGGVALKLKFRVEISGAVSRETTELPALLPGSTTMILSDLLSSKPSPSEPIKWTFAFEDEGGRKYVIEETVNLSQKRISYVPTKG